MHVVNFKSEMWSKRIVIVICNLFGGDVSDDRNFN